MSSLPETQIVPATAGSLAVCTYGDPAGSPLFHLHGTPGSRYQRYPDEAAYARAGFRVITFDRPGYGRSDRRRGRTLLDGARDIASVADALGLDRFAVLGVSGGGPYALAAAASLPERVTACACVVSAAPRDADIDWYAGMNEDQIAEVKAADSGERALTERTEERMRRFLAQCAEGRTPFPGSEAAVKVALEWMPEAWAKGPGGAVDDTLAELMPWGFDPATIRVPTSVWAALGDDLCPYAHGEWLARRIPGATLHTLEGGHLAFLGRFDEILETMGVAAPNPEGRPVGS